MQDHGMAIPRNMESSLAPQAHQMGTSTAGRVRHDVSLLSSHDLFLFNEGSHFRLYEKLGAHVLDSPEGSGTYFAVWAPSAGQVAVMGDFNGWNKNSHHLAPKAQSGIWEGFIPGVGPGTAYKYHVRSRYHGHRVDKADPFAFLHEEPPRTASVVCDLNFAWRDGDWMDQRRARQGLKAPIAIYEVHLGSWMRIPEESNRPLTYRELAPRLTAHMQFMGFTHVEFLPVMEHPFYGSWGYQVTGFFAPTHRYGKPQDFMFLIDYLHRHGIGVILDWVPAHFPTDEHGLVYFDGTHLYEHADPQQGIHPDWKSAIFNYGRHEIRSFLISNALFWLDRYHIDGLRVDAVASMLYLDYSRKPGQWVPNTYGGRENLDAINLLRRFNEEVYKNYPDCQTIAEESTAWPMVARPTYLGGLGFGFKWDLGWMHDTLTYMARDPIHRSHHHNELTFRSLYAFSENFILPLSHDEVVHGKQSLLSKMPGDNWQKFANLRLLTGYQYAQAGKKLLFMGDEFGQWQEWHHDQSLDWNLLDSPVHAGMLHWIQDLNRLYASRPALHELDCESRGFEWIDCADAAGSILSFLRRGENPGQMMLIVCNFTPVVRFDYRVGVPARGFWQEALNSDAPIYGGGGQGNLGGQDAGPEPFHGRPYSLKLTLPPLGIVFFEASLAAEDH
jgi:1,4-alpha-glucan branching enzyme